MAISIFKVFAAGEILTASDLSSSFSYLTTNALAMISPLTGDLDFNGNAIIIDADADSTISAAVDDIIKFQLQNVACFYFNGAVASVVNGMTFTATETAVDPSIAAQGSDTNIGLKLTPKGTGAVTLNGPVTAAGILTASSTVIEHVGADVASANALAIDIAGNIFDVTGTTSITSMNTKGVGTVVVLQFDGILTLTHHSTDLVLPAGKNITTYAGYIATFVEYATGDWRLVSQSRSATPCLVIAYLTADFNTASGTPTEIGSSTSAFTEIVDRGGDFDAATGRFTAPVTGIYEVEFFVTLEGLSANATEEFYGQIANGGASITDIYIAGSTASQSLAATDPELVSVGSGKISLAASATIALWTTHVTGATRNVLAGGAGGTQISIALVG